MDFSSNAGRRTGILMTTPQRPTVDELQSLTFAPETASALAHVNDLAKLLRSIPVHLFTPELKNDRDRVLNDHLSDLLGAYRDARAAGNDSADAELVEGLNPIAEEIGRIVSACQARANDALAIQNRFLETQYPADTGYGLTVTPAVALPIQRVPVEGDAPRKLGPDSLDALISARPAVETPAHPKNTKEIEVSSAAIFFAFLILAGLIFAISYDMTHDRDAEQRAASQAVRRANMAKVAVTAKIDSVHRQLDRPENKGAPAAVSAVVDLHGTVQNLSSDQLSTLSLVVDLYSCPTINAPLNACAFVDAISNDVEGAAGLNPRLTARFKEHWTGDIPNVEGHLRAVVNLKDVYFYPSELR